MAHISHLVLHNQVVLDVDGGLHIVADDAGAFAAGRHCSILSVTFSSLMPKSSEMTCPPVKVAMSTLSRRGELHNERCLGEIVCIPRLPSTTIPIDIGVTECG